MRMAHKPIFSVVTTTTPGTVNGTPKVIYSVTRIVPTGQTAYRKLGLGKKSPTPKGRTAKSTSTNYKLCIKKYRLNYTNLRRRGTVKLYRNNSMSWRIAVRQ